MKNAIYNLGNHVPDEELFTSEKRGAVLQMAPSSLFEPLVAILTPHLGQPISEVICTLADLGEVESMWSWKRVWFATERKGLGAP